MALILFFDEDRASIYSGTRNLDFFFSETETPDSPSNFYKFVRRKGRRPRVRKPT
jgi:hypothetical protein